MLSKQSWIVDVKNHNVSLTIVYAYTEEADISEIRAIAGKETFVSDRTNVSIINALREEVAALEATVQELKKQKSSAHMPSKEGRHG